MIQFDQILPGIFVGTCPSVRTDVERLRAALGVTAVLNLQTDRDFQELEIDWPGLEADYLDQGIQVFRQPILDFDREDLERLISDAGRCLERLLSVGHTVYVHCTAGRERSPAAVIAYLVESDQHTLAGAVELVTSRRNCSPFVDVLEKVYPAGGEDAA